MAKLGTSPPLSQKRVRELLDEGKQLRETVRARYQTDRTVSERKLRILVD